MKLTLPDETPQQPFTPLDPEAMTRITNSVVREFERQARRAFPPAPFKGAGVYALYYRGPFPAYEPLARHNQTAWAMPIYIGKAVPVGRRKGLQTSASLDSSALFHRISSDHAKSLREATNLNSADFAFSYLVLAESVIEFCESILIQHYQPVWNGCLDGFGNHNPGSGRFNAQRPGWDEVHPGRPWAASLQPSKHTASEWIGLIETYLREVSSGVYERITVRDDGGAADGDGDE